MLIECDEITQGNWQPVAVEVGKRIAVEMLLKAGDQDGDAE